MSATRTAKTHWEGTLFEGAGQVTLESSGIGTFDVSWPARAEERLRMFLEQYWGGPKTYQERRGHPRLRMRHAPFAVSPKARDHWLTHMRAAVDEAVDDGTLAPELEQQLWAYFEHAANFMVNTFEEPTA